jgi:DHA1 family tetracycline resistance protein-like MFS transporter
VNLRRISPLVAIFCTVFVDLIGFGIVIPLLPFYSEHFQASPQVVTLVLATYSFMQFIFAPVWGRLSDLYGRKPILVVSLAGIALSYVWIGFAASLWELIAARAAAGLMAGNLSAAQAYIADITPPERRAQGMGLIGAAFGLGFILGPAIGGVLGGPNPHEPHFLEPALTAAALSCAALLFAIVFLKESLEPEARAAAARTPRPGRFTLLVGAWRNDELRIFVLLFFLATFAFAGLESTFALWSERVFGWGAKQNGYLFAYTGVLSALVQGGLIRRLAARFGEKRLVVQGAAALAIGMAIIPFVASLPLLLAAMALIAYGAGITNPSLSSLISLAAGKTERGGVLGVSQSAASLARILGPAFAGFVFTLAGRNGPYIAGAVLMIVVLAFGFHLLRRSPAGATDAA